MSGTVPFMARIAQSWGAGFPRMVPVLLAGLASLAAVAGLAQVGQITAKKAAAVVLLTVIFGIAYVTKRAKDVFLFGFIFSLTYNRQYFVLQDLLGNPGTQGPYVIVADVFIFGLLCIWIYERVLVKRTASPKGGALWFWYLPFGLACVFSMFVATHVDWAAFELIRVAKVGLILWYARYHIGQRAWRICVGAFGAALSVQAILGIVEGAFPRRGILWLVGLGKVEVVMPQALEGDSLYGWTRAQGTMNHPPNLACYMLLTIPVFVALALSHPERSRRTVCALVAMVGLAGLGCTLSRWPVVLMATLLVLLLLGLAALRVVNVKHTLALISFGILITAAIGVALSDFIATRISRDWDASIDQRLDGYRAAFHMYQNANPLFGVGLNNYRVHMLNYEPDLAWIYKYESLALDMNVRFPTAPQNAFLFVLAETGFAGLLAFMIYVMGAIYTGAKGVVCTRGHHRAAIFGLLIGFVGVMLEQLIDHSYWVDPILYSTALVVGLMNNARTLSLEEVSQ